MNVPTDFGIRGRTNASIAIGRALHFSRRHDSRSTSRVGLNLATYRSELPIFKAHVTYRPAGRITPINKRREKTFLVFYCKSVFESGSEILWVLGQLDRPQERKGSVGILRGIQLPSCHDNPENV